MAFSSVDTVFTSFDYVLFFTLTLSFFCAWRYVLRIASLLMRVGFRLSCATFLAFVFQGAMYFTFPYQTARRYFAGDVGVDVGFGRGRSTGTEL
jgi:hypothetical protein